MDLSELSSGYSMNCDEWMVQKTSLSMFWQYSLSSANLASDWMRAKRTPLGTEDDCLYLSAYVPPSGSPFYDSADSNCHIAEVEKFISDLLEEFGDVNIICNGDFNARTANYQVNQDFVQNYENDMADKSAVESRKTAR